MCSSDLNSRFWYTRTERRTLVLLLVLVLGFNFSGRLFKRHIAARQIKSTFVFQSEHIYHTPTAQDKVQPKLLELNDADSVALIALYGIGPVYAKRIIKYRNLLGGFFCKEQLYEVYGMDSSRYTGFQRMIYVDSLKIKKVNMGVVGFKELLRHPYIDYELVKSFIRYRDQNGPPAQVDDIWENRVWPDSIQYRLRPYLFCD